MNAERRPDTHSDMVFIPHNDYRETYITLVPKMDEGLEHMLTRVKDIIEEIDVEVVKWDMFGHSSLYSETIGILKDQYKGLNWPVNWVEGSKNIKKGVDGIQVYAVTGVPVQTLHHEDVPIGRQFENTYGAFTFLGPLIPAETIDSYDKQAQSVFRM